MKKVIKHTVYSQTEVKGMGILGMGIGMGMGLGMGMGIGKGVT